MSRIKRAFPVRVGKRYLDNRGPNWATLVAWNGLFALFPIVLIMLTVLGAVLQDPNISGAIRSTVENALPSKAGHDDILRALNGLPDKTGIFAVAGFAGLLWSGSALFGAMEQGLCALYGCKPRGFIRGKLMAFGMILVFTALAVPLVLSGALLPALQSLNFVPGFFTSGPAALILQVAAGVLDGTLIFLAIYLIVPNRKQRFRRVLPGALAAGVLLEGFTMLFPAYVRYAGGFTTYGATFALFFLLMTYMFVLGQITMLGGAVSAEAEASRDATILAQRMDPPAITVPGKAQRERSVVQDPAN